MSQIGSKIFNEKSYEYNGRLNFSFMVSILNMLGRTQHMYKREDVVAAYRFIADVIEKGDFGWSGTFPLKPMAKSANIAPKETEEEIASVSEDTTSTVAQRRRRPPKSPEASEI
jgi:hypothetical protein